MQLFIDRILPDMPTKDFAEPAWRDHGQVVVVDDMDELWQVGDSFASEHVQVLTADPRQAEQMSAIFFFFFFVVYSFSVLLLDVHRAARGEMQQRLLALRAAVEPAGAAEHRLAFDALDLRVADRAQRGMSNSRRRRCAAPGARARLRESRRPRGARPRCRRPARPCAGPRRRCAASRSSR